VKTKCGAGILVSIAVSGGGVPSRQPTHRTARNLQNESRYFNREASSATSWPGFVKFASSH
jgi:hypothetical protein